MTVEGNSPMEATGTADDLIRRLRGLPPQGDMTSREERPVVFRQIISPRNLVTWLDHQSAAVKTYWRSRDGHTEIAGLDYIDMIRDKDGFFSSRLADHIHDWLTDHPWLCYLGGFRFDVAYPNDGRTPAWSEFGNGLFVLPKIQITRHFDIHTLTCHIPRGAFNADSVKSMISQLEGLSFEESYPASTEPGTFTRIDTPDHAQWERNINTALQTFDRGHAKKIVLARETRLEFEHDLNPWNILERLRANAEDCYLFGIQPAEGAAFIGATPERLYCRDQSSVETEALAGTRPRGQSKDEDAELEQELLSSDKDLREHSLVVESILAALHDLCEKISADQQPAVRKLSRVQHLATSISGIIRKGIADSEILAHLHPTPAVGGHPREAALKAIREIEAFDRGWYAGPVGRLSPAGTELAVGIRSGLVRGRSLTLYSGAGIVPGSNAEQEWDEIEQKMSGFLEAVGGTPK